MLWSLAFVPVTAWAQSNTFTVKAKVGVENAPAKAYLNYRADGKNIIDSAVVTNGSFQFTGSISEPAQAEILLDHKGTGLKNLGRNADVLMMYLEKGNIMIAAKDSVKKAVITGSAINTEYAKYMAFLAVPQKDIAAVNAEYNAASADEKKKSRLYERLTSQVF